MNSNFSGPSECLEAALDKFGNFAVTFNVNKTFNVGSIWRGGCGPTSAHSRGEPEKNKGVKPRSQGKDSQGRGAYVRQSGTVLIVSIFALLSHLFVGQA